MRVYHLKMHGSTLTLAEIEEVLETLRTEIEDSEPGDVALPTVTIGDMTEADFDALPEWSGW